MITNKLVPSTFINNLGYYLNCYDKQVVCIMENLVPNSIFYFLLFKDLEMNFNDVKALSLVRQKTGIDLKKKQIAFSNLGYFNRKNSNLILEQRNIIVKSDLYLDERYYNYGYTHFYNKMHHSHFIILKGYDEEREKYLIVDEDPRYVNSSKRSINWPYDIIEINDKELFDICKQKKHGEKGFTCVYTEIIKNNKFDSIDIHSVFNDYYKKITSTLDYGILERNLLNSVDQYINGNEFSFSIGNNPQSLSYVKLRNEQVNILYRCYRQLYINDKKCLDEIDKAFFDITKIYKKIYLLATKFAISKDRMISKTIFEQLEIAMVLERKVFKFQIKILKDIVNQKWLAL